MNNLLVGQRVSVKLKDKKLFEGYIARQKNGNKVVVSNDKWVPFSECEKLVKKGRIVEDAIAQGFNTLFAPIDFKKVQDDKSKEELIDSAVAVMKQQDKDAAKQTDEDLKALASNALENVKNKNELAKGETTETKIAQEKIKEFELEDENERDEAIKNSQSIQEAVRKYKENKDKAIEDRLKIITENNMAEGSFEERFAKAHRVLESKDERPNKLFESFKKEADEAIETSLKESGYYNIEPEFEKFVESFQLQAGPSYSLDALFEHVVACVKPSEELLESVKNIPNGADRLVALCEATKKKALAEHTCAELAIIGANTALRSTLEQGMDMLNKTALTQAGNGILQEGLHELANNFKDKITSTFIATLAKSEGVKNLVGNANGDVLKALAQKMLNAINQNKSLAATFSQNVLGQIVRDGVLPGNTMVG